MKRTKTNKTALWFIVGIILGLLIGSAGGYFYAAKSARGNFGRPSSFQISEQSKAEVTSLFESNPGQDSLTSYCGQNRMNCAYYCRSINPNNDFCSQFLNLSRGGIAPKR